MSIENLKKVFSAMTGCDAWSLQLLKIKTSKRDGTSYIGREITFTPAGELNNFVSEIVKRYIDTEKGVLRSFQGITEYDIV